MKGLLLASLLLLPTAAPQSGARVPFESVVRGETEGAENRALVVRDAFEARGFARTLPDRERMLVEQIDFRRYYAFAAFWSFPMSGGRVEIESVRRRAATVTVRVLLTEPPPFGGPVHPTSMSAFHVIQVPRRALTLPALPRVVILPVWQTIGRSSAHRSLSRGFIAGSLEGTRRFALALRAEHRAKLFEVDYRRFVVVAAFATLPDCGFAVEIRSLRRSRQRLNVVLAVHRAPPGVAFCFAVTTFYHAVKVPRAVLGVPLPRLVLLKQE